MKLRGIPLQVSGDLAQGNYKKAVLNLHNIYYPSTQSFTIRVFLNQPDAEANTPPAGNVHYVGRVSVMAREHFSSNEEKGYLPWARSSFEPRSADPDPPLNAALDATRAVRELAQTDQNLNVTLVLVDNKGRELPEDLLRFDGVSLSLEA